MQSNLSGPQSSDAGFRINGDMPATISTLGLAGDYGQYNNVLDAIADNTATRILRVTVPNSNNGCVIRVLVMSVITASGHEADSVRVVQYLIPVSRHAGAVAVIAISAAVGAQIATAGTSTLTSVLTVSAVTGGATAINTFDVNVTNVGTPAGISRTQVFAEILNDRGSTGNYPGAPATTGCTLSQ